MGKIVTVNTGVSNLVLPDGKTYGAGNQAVLTDVEYSALSTTQTSSVTLVGSTTDPTRAPGSVASAQAAANAAVGLAIVF